MALEYGRGPVPRIPSDSYIPLLNSGQFLLGLDDYFDYYWNERLRARLHLSLPSQVGLAVGFNHEEAFFATGDDRFQSVKSGLEAAAQSGD